jgi:hypothetical protein
MRKLIVEQKWGYATHRIELLCGFLHRHRLLFQLLMSLDKGWLIH